MAHEPDSRPPISSLRATETVDPPEWFVDQANVADPAVYDRFERDWPACWRTAGSLLTWADAYDSVLTRGDAALRWFDGGVLNASYNCVDRHVEAGRGDEAALHWAGRTGESTTYTYDDLHREVNETAAALRGLGVEAGDVVTLYMPMMPELPVTMLACARLGALHNVVFSGYSAAELAERISRTDSRVLVTCDSYYRGGAAVNQKNKADNACLSVDHDVETVVVRRFGDTYLGDDQHEFDDLLAAQAGAQVDPVPRAAADPLFVIYTSGTTGEPDRVTHTTGGYLSYVAWTSHAVLDVEPEDTYWCAADIAWITGHSYIVYGPLALGATTLLYEGSADQPAHDRLWRQVEAHDVDVFYTAPTAIRSFMKRGADGPDEYDLSSLRLLGSVGEPINPSGWHWYRTHVGNSRCPVVDTWWQTETGGIMVSTLPGVDQMKPGAAGRGVPGIAVSVVDDDGAEVGPNVAGSLAITRPWPGMPRSMLTEATDPDWAYVTGDRAVQEADGYVTLLGRADDTLTVDDEPVGVTSVEGAIVEVDGVAEAAVVESARREDVVAYVSTTRDRQADQQLRGDIVDHVIQVLGQETCPRRFVFTAELPKTHSGKIMRRVLAAIVDGDDYGDTSALRNPETVGEIELVVGREVSD
ncbi:acetate--CoA ligase [Haloarchaeobius amylolyticus]|uniref:acetate--CoA ligase n=1 Tax=Haloarchaeobius amylolyticus TaxID=1198296 RepID=UPI002270862C